MSVVANTKYMTETTPPKNWSRVRIAGVEPLVDAGRWPVKRTQGEKLEVVAGVIVDGHSMLTVELEYGLEADERQILPMRLRYNDEYIASFRPEKLGRYTYKVRAWVDQFATWQDEFRRRVEGEEEKLELRIELRDGAALLREAAAKASKRDASRLGSVADTMDEGNIEIALTHEVADLAERCNPKKNTVESRDYALVVDRELARFGAWYEFFPRSARPDGRHASLDEAAARLPRIRELGFDIVYLPPVHPIGKTNRKGKDNTLPAKANDPGSPWAIGGLLANGDRGGHKSVHPDLGGIEAFDRFVARAEKLDLKVALDIAFQTSPDHPYVHDHPNWFRQRADGSIRYAENPPKKYQDVHPIDFESEDLAGLWQELKSVFEFWIDHGVKIFRVDNPHTKPFAFWEWCLEDLRRQHPDLIFLAEAFTRPKTMFTMAKLGFNNSYTYFTWRNTKAELEEYGRELFQGEVTNFFRPNFWPNTPDILHDYLADGGRAAHIVRFVLAATMSPVYGVYGPPFEHVDNRQHPSREEYACNEKYEIRTWKWNDAASLQPLFQKVNRIRRDNPALQHFRNLRFHETAHPQLLAYSKQTRRNLILVVLNLDAQNAHEGMVELPPADLGLPSDRPYKLVDLLYDTLYEWSGASNYVRIDPQEMPAHIFQVQ